MMTPFVQHTRRHHFAYFAKVARVFIWSLDANGTSTKEVLLLVLHEKQYFSTHTLYCCRIFDPYNFRRNLASSGVRFNEPSLARMHSRSRRTKAVVRQKSEEEGEQEKRSRSLSPKSKKKPIPFISTTQVWVLGFYIMSQ